LGRGQRIKANVELGKNRHSYELGFYEPYIEKGGTSLGVNLYRRVRDVSKKIEGSEDKLKGSLTIDGGDLTLGRPLGDFSRGRLTFKMTNNKYKLDSEADPADFYGDYKNRTIGFGINTNTVDHPMYPTEGFKNDAYVEAGVLLESAENNKYAKLRLEHSRFYEIKDGGYVLALRAMGGRLLGQDLPENEKFVIGGAETLRGYSLGANSSLKGNQMLVMNAEFRFPIVDKVTGVVFSDFGKAWDNGMVTLDDFNNSFGLGVRLDTPLGLLRLDYGFGRDEERDLKGQFYFGIGQTF
ncbi:MAG TPA: BamA/TamA family outer membrane protein, partial [Firmicutes bacterium]|nr:BamA/TamA family outer membrane protein [Bacillota bacterium]